MKVFVDAEFLFSAALGGSAFRLLSATAAARSVAVCTSPPCLSEAERNLRALPPEALEGLSAMLLGIALVAEAQEPPGEPSAVLPEKVWHVLAAALAARSDVLLAGNIRHCGALMARDDLPLRVRTLRGFLLSA